MADDNLDAPVWGDAVSASPGKFRTEDVADELSATFASAAIHHEQSGDEEEEEQHTEEAVPEEHSEPEAEDEAPKEPPRTPKKDTSGLLSSLTKDADNGFVAEVVSPKKDEALFKGTNLLETDADDKENSTNGNATSPSKLRRQNVYRAPRLRRVPLKASSTDKPLDTPSDAEPSKGSDPLGPLGGVSTDDSESAGQQLSPGENLVKLAEAPLFEINRTPLSPLKNKQDMVPSAPNTAPSSQSSKPSRTASGPNSEIEAAKLRLKSKQNPEVKMEIQVGDPIKVGELTGAHIAYSVRTTSESGLFKDKVTTVSRRYRDFRWLYRQLQSTHPGRVIPPPPDKQAVGRFNQDFIEGRRFALERMLVKISESPSLQKDQDFIMFLESDRFTSEAREREKAAASQSIFTEHESDSLNNNGGGLFGSLGGAFSFTPKIVEPDDYFKEKKSYIESLDTQFKVFLKNLEAIVMQRHDLSSVTEEFSNVIMTLADLEVSKSTTDIFQEFASTQTRIKELLDRLSLQDMLTLGSTLDEYQRVIASIKSTFEQRDKLLIHLVNCEGELKKKQASLDKYVKYNKTQTDKIEVIRGELNTLEQKHKSARDKFDSVSETIKEELANFEVEKIHDFRNSIEIYLESSIESQKEAVELWETYYSKTLSTI